MTGYLIAKYVPDLARNEPVNVGVIAYDGTTALARFVGEDEQGQMDLRRVRHRIPSSRVYRQWVQFWRRAVREPAAVDAELAEFSGGDPAVIERLVAASGRDFYLEAGGRVIFDADQTPLEQALDDLFAQLVVQREPADELSLRQKALETFRLAGVSLNQRTFKERPPVTISLHGIEIEEEFSFAVRNGAWHYVKEVAFDAQSVRRTRKEVLESVTILEHAPREFRRRLAIFDGEDVPADARPLVAVLNALQVPVVDVGAPDRAASFVREVIGVDAPPRRP